jgi:integrase/recombinase XerC
MAGIFRPTIIRYVDSRGTRGTRKNPVTKKTPGARPIREKSKTYWGRVADADGEVRPVKLCDDAEAAEEMLAAMKQRAKRIARGDIDPFEDHRSRPLAEHLEDFRRFLESKDNTAEHVALTVNRVSAAFDGCGFKRLADLNAGRVANWLAEQRKPKKDIEQDLLPMMRKLRDAGKSLQAIADKLNAKGHQTRRGESWTLAGVRRVLRSEKADNIVAGLSIASSNHHLVALKSFGSWLVKDRRSPENPFAHLSRLNAQVDVRHERRALTADELSRTIQAAERSDKSFRGVNGSTRALLYRMAAMTGFRADELASLTPASFDLKSDPPTVTIEAAYSKHRREDFLPLHPDLAARLRQWLSERERRQDDQRVILSLNRAADAKRERLFPGTWPGKAAEMLRIDLDAAEIAYFTDAGFADFHSLRHTFISHLVTGGVHPKVAQQLARHSTITLTMDRYAHLGLIDMTSGLSALPSIGSSDANECRATGTTDDAAAVGCTNGCTRPTEINHFQPFSPVAMSTIDDSLPTTKKPQFPAGNEAFCENDDERRRWESNPRMTDLQSVALATWLRRRIRGGM